MPGQPAAPDAPAFGGGGVPLSTGVRRPPTSRIGSTRWTSPVFARIEPPASAGRFARLPPGPRAPTSPAMPDAPTAVDRIDTAIARIEAAIAARAQAGDALARRHAALKARMAEAVSALDEVIARGNAG